LRERVPHVAGEVETILARADVGLDLASLSRAFTIRANEAFVVANAARLADAVSADAPGVQLYFAPKPDKDARPLREGHVDLEIGVLGESGPELMVQALYRDRFVAAVRSGHPFSDHEPSVESYAEAGHVVASKRGSPGGPVDAALAELGLARRSVLVVPSFPAALAVATQSDLVALIPNSFALAELARCAAWGGPLPHYFELPVKTGRITVSQIWHPRFNNDPAHRWLRGLVRSCCSPETGRSEG